MKDINILVICEDRARGLKDFVLNIQDQMNEPRLVKYHFIVHEKMTIFESTTNPINNLSPSKYDIIVTMLGTNDLFTRHTNGHISPIYDDIGNLVDVLTDKLQQSKSYLKQYCKYVIVCHVLGLDFDRFNRYRTDFRQQQAILDQALPYLNQSIISINADDELATPMIQDSLHTRTQGTRFQKYHKLYDGLNPRSSLIISWAEHLHKCITRNIEFLFPFD